MISTISSTIHSCTNSTIHEVEKIGATITEFNPITTCFTSSLSGLYNQIDPQALAIEKIQKKWKASGLDPEVVKLAPDCAKFLVESGMAFIMGSLNHAETNETLIRVANNTVEIMVDGEFIRWEDFKERFEYDSALWHNMFIEKEGQKEVWTCVSPRLGGFIKNHPLKYGAPYPIDKLTSEELEQLKQHASSDSSNSKKAEAILQIYTSPGGDLRPEGGSYGTSHYGVRVISPEGYVYSFAIFKDTNAPNLSNPVTVLRTIKGEIAMMDYTEFKPHSGRLVTSLPMENQDMEAVFTLLKKKNLCFNIQKYNCASFAVDVLGAAGYPVDIKTPMEALLIPGLASQLPFIGTYISRALAKVTNIAAKVWGWLPTGLQNVLSKTTSIVTAPLQFAGRLIRNLGCLLAFGWYVTPGGQEALDAGAEDIRPIKSFWDLLKEETGYVNSSVELVKWQKKNLLTEIHKPTPTAKLQVLAPQI